MEKPAQFGVEINAGRKVGVKKPLKQRQIWAIRFFLESSRTFFHKDFMLLDKCPSEDFLNRKN